MWCVETLTLLFSKDIEIDSLNRLVGKKYKNIYPFQFSSEQDIESVYKVFPAPLTNKEAFKKYDIIKHNFLELIVAEPNKIPTQEYTPATIQQVKEAIQNHLKENTIRINSEFVKATAYSLDALQSLSRKLKDLPESIYKLTNKDRVFIYSIFQDTAVIYFSNTDEAVGYISNNHNVNKIFCGTYTDLIQRENPKQTAVVPQKATTHKVPIVLLKKKQKGFINTNLKTSPFTIQEYYSIGCNDDYNSIIVSYYFQKSVDIISFGALTPFMLLSKIQENNDIFYVDSITNRLYNYFYKNNINLTSLLKYTHNRTSPVEVNQLNKDERAAVIFTKDYKIEFDGKDGKNNRKLKNKFEKLIAENKIKITVTRDIKRIRETLPDIYELIIKWAKIKNKEESLGISNGFSSFVPFLSDEALTNIKLLMVDIRDETNQLIGFSLTYKPYKDMVILSQGVTLNSKDVYSGLQKYIHFLEIAEWGKEQCDICRGTTNGRILRYNLISLKADKLLRFNIKRGA